jgi:PhnB protein
MAIINAYLKFNGNCREAMLFYKDCLGAELSFQTIAGSAIEDECPAYMKDQILHATLLLGDLVLMGSDMTGPDGYYKGNTVALSLSCGSETEIHQFFEKLSRNGIVQHKISPSFWGAIFGVVIDKYGNTWMLNFDKNTTTTNQIRIHND